jgi:hypothetical protein
MWTMFRLAIFFCLVEFVAVGQGTPVASQFERLMGEPKEVVNDLVNFLWKGGNAGRTAGLAACLFRQEYPQSIGRTGRT